MKEVINITNFSGGIINDDTIQSDKHFANLEGLDWRSKPGYLVLNRYLKGNGSSNASGFLVDEQFMFFGIHDNTLYVATRITSTNTYRFFKFNSFSDNYLTLVGTVADSYVDGSCPGLVSYKGYLFFSEDSSIGHIEPSINGNVILSFGGDPTFENRISGHIMVTLNNKLYISDGDVIAELDGGVGGPISSAWIFTAVKNRVSGTIKSMILFGNYLAIGTNSGDLYLWDGESAGSESVHNFSFPIIGLLEYRNMLYVFCSGSNFVYVYNGSDLSPVLQLNDKYVVGSCYKYKDGFLFLVGTHSGLRETLYYFNGTSFSDYGSCFPASPYISFYSYFDFTFLFRNVSGSIPEYYSNQELSFPTNYIYTELETVKYEFVNKSNFKTLIKGIRIDGVSGGDCDLQYSIDGGDYSVARNADFGKMVFFLKRVETFQIKLTNISNSITGIKIFI